MKIARLIFVAAALLTSTAYVNAGVVVGDYEWRQLTDTQGLSPRQLASIYDTSTGQLGAGNTTFAGVDFTGWTWASVDDVRGLFTSILDNDFSFDATNRSYEEANSTWAPAIIDGDGAGADMGLFHATSAGASAEFLYGITREIVDFGGTTGVRVLSAYIHNSYGTESYNKDNATTAVAVDIDQTLRGFWMYRAAPAGSVTLPAPATLPLLATALVFGWMIRRRRAN